MNKQTGKQFGEDNPCRALPDIKVLTVRIAEKRYHTAFPVSGDDMPLIDRAARKLSAAYLRITKSPDPSLSTVATGAGPFPIKYDANTQRSIERDTFGRV